MLALGAHSMTITSPLDMELAQATLPALPEGKNYILGKYPALFLDNIYAITEHEDDERLDLMLHSNLDYTIAK